MGRLAMLISEPSHLGMSLQHTSEPFFSASNLNLYQSELQSPAQMIFCFLHRTPHSSMHSSLHRWLLSCLPRVEGLLVSQRALTACCRVSKDTLPYISLELDLSV